MAAAYTKDFLISAYLSRFMECCTIEQLENLEKIATDFFDKVGKDKFRTYASLDAEAIRKYKSSI